MKKMLKGPVAGCLVLCVLGVMLSAEPGVPGEMVYKMTGKISAVVPDHNIVVIEVPMKSGEVFTVAGHPAPDAVLQKGGRSAVLADFSPGQQVTVEWKHTETGHLILMLKG